MIDSVENDATLFVLREKENFFSTHKIIQVKR